MEYYLREDRILDTPAGGVLSQKRKQRTNLHGSKKTPHIPKLQAESWFEPVPKIKYVGFRFPPTGNCILDAIGNMLPYFPSSSGTANLWNLPVCNVGPNIHGESFITKFQIYMRCTYDFRDVIQRAGLISYQSISRQLVDKWGCKPFHSQYMILRYTWMLLAQLYSIVMSTV